MEQPDGLRATMGFIPQVGKVERRRAGGKSR
jgi:hypothetical protein